MANYVYSILAAITAGDVRCDQLQTELNVGLTGTINSVTHYGDELTIETADTLTTPDLLALPALLLLHSPVEPVSGVGSDYGTEFQYVYDQTIHVTTSTSYQTRATLNCAPLTGGTYVVELSAIYNGDSTRFSTIVGLFEDGNLMGKTIRHEPKDTNGTEMGGASAGIAANVRHFRSYAEGDTPSFAVKHASESSGVQVGITDIALTITRVGG